MKNSFILYNDNYETIKKLCTEDKAGLLDAIFNYSINKGKIELSPVAEVVFSFIKRSMFRDEKKWKDIKKARSIAGRLGGLKRVQNEGLLRSKSSKSKQGQANQAVTVTDTVTVTVNKEIYKDIFNFYLDTAKTKEILTDGRKIKVLARLKKFTPEQVKTAIEKCFKDSFYSGDNDRGWKANADYVFKNDETIDKFLNMTPRIKKEENKSMVASMVDQAKKDLFKEDKQ